MKTATVLAAILLMGSATTCTHAHQGIHGAPVPLFVTQFVPPSEYEAWYHDAEQCAGLKGDYGAVRWGVVPLPWGDTTYAQWSVAHDGAGFVRHVSIVVNARMWRDSVLIMHESLHDILWRNGWVPPDIPALASNNDAIRILHPSPPYGKCAPIFYPWNGSQ